MANSQYSERVIEGMQMLFGQGFLSPGGAPEVDEMLEGEKVSGRTVIDLGCGIGGGTLMLAGKYDAARVIAVDVEPDSLARTRAAADAAGLGDRVETLQVSPGPLPLPDGCADMVFTKDVVCHIDDKAAAFAEMARLLRPGGRLVCADFVENKPGEADPEGIALFDAWVDVLKTYGLSFHYERWDVYERALMGAGFDGPAIFDHTGNSATVARREYDLVTGPDCGPIRERLGEDYFKVRIKTSEMRALALERRGLLHVHIRADKPVG